MKKTCFMGSKLRETISRLDADVFETVKNLECSYCKYILNNTKKTACYHYFCKTCVKQILLNKKSNVCPVCNKVIKRREPIDAVNRNFVSGACREIIDTFFADVDVAVSIWDISEQFVKNLKVQKYFIDLKNVNKYNTPYASQKINFDSSEKQHVAAEHGHNTRKRPNIAQMSESSVDSNEPLAKKRLKILFQYPSAASKKKETDASLLSISQADSVDFLTNLSVTDSVTKKMKTLNKIAPEEKDQWFEKTGDDFYQNDSITPIFQVNDESLIQTTQNENQIVSKLPDERATVSELKIPTKGLGPILEPPIINASDYLEAEDASRNNISTEEKINVDKEIDPYEYIPSQHSQHPKISKKKTPRKRGKQKRGVYARRSYSKVAESKVIPSADEKITASQKFENLVAESKTEQKHTLFNSQDEINTTFSECSEANIYLPPKTRYSRRLKGDTTYTIPEIPITSSPNKAEKQNKQKRGSHRFINDSRLSSQLVFEDKADINAKVDLVKQNIDIPVKGKKVCGVLLLSNEKSGLVTEEGSSDSDWDKPLFQVMSSARSKKNIAMQGNNVIFSTKNIEPIKDDSFYSPLSCPEDITDVNFVQDSKEEAAGSGLLKASPHVSHSDNISAGDEGTKQKETSVEKLNVSLVIEDCLHGLPASKIPVSDDKIKCNETPPKELSVLSLTEDRSSPKKSNVCLVTKDRSPGWSRMSKFLDDFKSPKRQHLKTLNISRGDVSTSGTKKSDARNSKSIISSDETLEEKELTIEDGERYSVAEHKNESGDDNLMIGNRSDEEVLETSFKNIATVDMGNDKPIKSLNEPAAVEENMPQDLGLSCDSNDGYQYLTRQYITFSGTNDEYTEEIKLNPNEIRRMSKSEMEQVIFGSVPNLSSPVILSRSLGANQDNKNSYEGPHTSDHQPTSATVLPDSSTAKESVLSTDTQSPVPFNRIMKFVLLKKSETIQFPAGKLFLELGEFSPEMRDDHIIVNIVFPQNVRANHPSHLPHNIRNKIDPKEIDVCVGTETLVAEKEVKPTRTSKDVGIQAVSTNRNIHTSPVYKVMGSISKCVGTDVEYRNIATQTSYPDHRDIGVQLSLETSHTSTKRKIEQSEIEWKEFDGFIASSGGSEKKVCMTQRNVIPAEDFKIFETHDDDEKSKDISTEMKFAKDLDADKSYFQSNLIKDTSNRETSPFMGLDPQIEDEFQSSWKNVTNETPKVCKKNSSHESFPTLKRTKGRRCHTDFKDSIETELPDKPNKENSGLQNTPIKTHGKEIVTIASEESDSDMFVEQTPPREYPFQRPIDFSVNDWKTVSRMSNEKLVEKTQENLSPDEDKNSNSSVILPTPQCVQNKISSKSIEFLSKDTFLKGTSSTFLKEGETGKLLSEYVEGTTTEEKAMTLKQSNENLAVLKKKMCLVTSAVKNIEQVETFAKKFDLELCNNFTTHTTHLVVGLYDQEGLKNVPLCKMKLLWALVSGIWVLSEEWVKDCIRENRLLPEEPYECKDPLGGNTCKISRLLLNKKVFENVEICLHGDLLHKLADLIEHGGAFVINNISKFSYTPGVLRLIVVGAETKTTEKQVQDLFISSRTAVVSEDYLTYSILIHQPSAIASYLVCCTNQEELLQLGYSLELLQ